MNMARQKGTAEKLEQWLFDNQGTSRADQLTGDQVRKAAQDVAGISDFAAQYDKTLVEVKNDAGMGQLVGVHSTPTFFINGRRIAGMLQPRAFDAAIALELQRAK
jgi:protein-disulfide isomerase